MDCWNTVILRSCQSIAVSLISYFTSYYTGVVVLCCFVVIISWCSDGTLLASGSRDGMCKIWSVSDNASTSNSQGNPVTPVTSIYRHQHLLLTLLIHCCFCPISISIFVFIFISTYSSTAICHSYLQKCCAVANALVKMSTYIVSITVTLLHTPRRCRCQLLLSVFLLSIQWCVRYSCSLWPLYRSFSLLLHPCSRRWNRWH